MLSLIFSTVSWRSAAHTKIGKQSLTILQNDNRESASFYLEEHSKYLFLVKVGFVDPDIFEFGTGTHYYVYPGPCENTGQYFPPAERCPSNQSARTHLEEHYEQALSYYAEGKIVKAFINLGRACHYLQDISCPPHAAGIQYPKVGTNYHKLYEKYIDSVIKTIPSHATTAKDKYGIMDEKGIGYILNDISKNAAAYKENVLSGDEEQYKLTYPSISASEIYTAVFLDKFANDVKALSK